LTVNCDAPFWNMLRFNLRRFSEVMNRFGEHVHHDEQGEAMEVDPINPTLKGTERLKLKQNEPLSIFGFKLKIRRYNMGRLAVSRNGTR